MNNEPVAWINREVGSGSILDWEKDPYADTNIPLYTHPHSDKSVKAKTYEDAIEECAQRAEAYAYMSENFNVLAHELRAILRKAQENEQ